MLPPIPGLYRCYVHKDCVCNEVISATNRVLGEVPKPTSKGMAELRRAARRVGKLLPRVAVWDDEEVLATMTGRRLRRYAVAAEELNMYGVGPDDARITAFIKPEKTDPGAKTNPDPRMIQFRSPRYTFALFKWLKPCEKALYNITGPNGLRAIAKGLNHLERAALLSRKMEQFRRPVVYSIDASRWDKHVSKEVLQLEHSIYLRMHANPPELQTLLARQLYNKCRTMKGVSYRVSGGRMSGDANTALGNCLLMVIMCYAMAEKLQLQKWDILDDGDDCLLIVEQNEEGKLEGIVETFLQYGQELKLENRSTSVEGVAFCQHHPCLVGGRWRMVQDWRKVLSTRAAGCKHWNDPALRRGMARAVGLCELALSPGVPVLQEYALALLRNAGDAPIPKAVHDDLEVWNRAMKEKPGVPKEIDLLSRESFADAFGLEPADQITIETALRQWEIDWDSVAEWDEELRAQTWKSDPSPLIVE